VIPFDIIRMAEDFSFISTITTTKRHRVAAKQMLTTVTRIASRAAAFDSEMNPTSM
jgi:hypothetical protein